MKKLVFMTPSDAEYGFSMAGVPQHVIESRDAEQAIENIMAEPDCGLLVIDERLIQDLPEERLRDLEQRWRGILLVLPSPEKPPAEVEDYAARLIRRAIGYHVRLKV